MSVRAWRLPTKSSLAGLRDTQWEFAPLRLELSLLNLEFGLLLSACFLHAPEARLTVVELGPSNYMHLHASPLLASRMHVFRCMHCTDFNLSGGCFAISLAIFYKCYVILSDV